MDVDPPLGQSVAQEALDFSRHVVLNERTGMLEPRHVDLRVFAIQDADGEVSVFPGGLTRVALEGGRITNNSSGGLCKPTWVAGAPQGNRVRMTR